MRGCEDLNLRRSVVILVKDASSRAFPEEALVAEIKEIAKSAGFWVSEVFECTVRNPFYRYYLSRGKVEEIKRRLKDLPEVEFVILSTEVTPSQQRNLEKEWQKRVLTKSEVIHEIFAERAKTREGKIRVELARLRFELSRLPGKGQVLSRTGGGIGTRGPGEQKIEVERRTIKKKISFLVQRLEQLEKQRAVQKKLRNENRVPVVAIVGYTNAGKSTLLNAITNATVAVKNQMFVTLDIISRESFLPGIGKVIFSDTVGFIREMPPTIKEAFKSTLLEVKEADLILEVLDITDPQYRMHFQVINQTLHEIGVGDYPKILVFNKVDLVSREIPNLERDIFEIASSCVFVSAKEKIGIENLRREIAALLSKRMVKLSLEIYPSQVQDLQREIYRFGYVESVESVGNGERIRLHCVIRRESKNYLEKKAAV
ncbi:MAG TPA: GTPase HflX [Candidatus Atribacteria bacterium]|nr:GTPase HflX [Candidatus Atribacteria bacterium]